MITGGAQQQDGSIGIKIAIVSIVLLGAAAAGYFFWRQHQAKVVQPNPQLNSSEMIKSNPILNKQ